jgi:hypothetical protein
VNGALGRDVASQARLAAEVSKMTPLIRALGDYHARHGLYPTRLDALGAKGLDVRDLADGYIYAASPTDQVYRSPACERRWKSEFEGLILKSETDLQRMNTAFAAQCVVGYRQITLQSPNFTFQGRRTLSTVDRWAYYSSFTGKWSTGWCSHEEVHDGREQTASSDGVCRP